MSARQLTPGQSLLMQAAAGFRANPHSWTRGWGIAPNGTVYGGGDEPPKDLLPLLLPCCIDVRLIQLGGRCGGDTAIGEARTLIYDHLGTPKERKSIWKWNDDVHRTPAQVVAMLEAASGVFVIGEPEVRQLLRAFQTGDRTVLTETNPALIAA